ncbi:unnamed protein product [Acanthosepion pharaonis]|uniref:Uncharacterized protein n=1 Tax=Acanthosepion pharaonis TaxID=158019 RepID=A0A812CLW1_ACAPH|nr:unnamed protein product [Sepia pharaonis]
MSICFSFLFFFLLLPRVTQFIYYWPKQVFIQFYLLSHSAHLSISPTHSLVYSALFSFLSLPFSVTFFLFSLFSFCFLPFTYFLASPFLFFFLFSRCHFFFFTFPVFTCANFSFFFLPSPFLLFLSILYSLFLDTRFLLRFLISSSSPTFLPFFYLSRFRSPLLYFSFSFIFHNYSILANFLLSFCCLSFFHFLSCLLLFLSLFYPFINSISSLFPSLSISVFFLTLFFIPTFSMTYLPSLLRLYCFSYIPPSY